MTTKYNRIPDTFRELIAIDSPSYGERNLCDALKSKLTELGVSCSEDDAGAKIGGNCGNLSAFVRGGIPGAPILLSAHLDTVEPSSGKAAVIDGDKVVSNGTAVLGADDVAGLTIILETITRLKETNTAHRGIELLLPVAEEKYGAGSSVFDYGKIQAKEAYILDLGGEIGEAANAAPTIFSFSVDITGKAAHAGFAPGSGIHAIQTAANAIVKLPSGAPDSGLTFNVGTIHGGTANNIVPYSCRVTGEIRSLEHAAVLRYWEYVKSVFEGEARISGASVDFVSKAEIIAYRVAESSPVARRFIHACETVGIRANIHSTLGGSDNNNFALHGIDGLVIACSMHDVHSTREYALLSEMEQCVELLTAILTEEST